MLILSKLQPSSETVLQQALKLFYLAVLILSASLSVNAQQSCDRLTEIKIMPFWNERVNDAAYYSIIEAGDSALPCLIRQITYTRKMRDPRQAPLFHICAEEAESSLAATKLKELVSQ